MVLRMKKLLFLAPALASQLSLANPPPYREKIRGVYENKIRQQAPPEKVFEVFATIKEGKAFYMTPSDFFKSVIPYNYSENRKNRLLEKYRSLVFELADANRDGRISFSEYMFFVILVSTGNKLVKQLFDEHGGALNREEFVLMMKDAKEANSMGKQTTKANLVDPRSVSFSAQDFESSCRQLYSEFFPSKKTVSFSDFLDLKELITEELLFYEFHSFPVAPDHSISAEDFAKSIVSYVQTAKIDGYLSRIEDLQLTGRVAYSEYVAFMATIQNTSLLEQKLFATNDKTGKRTVSMSQFRKIVKELSEDTRFCAKYSLAPSDLQIDVFFRVLDLDGTGYLEPSEFFDIFISRTVFGKEQIGRPTLKDLVSPFKVFANSLCKQLGYSPYFNVIDSSEKTREWAHYADSSSEKP